MLPYADGTGPSVTYRLPLIISVDAFAVAAQTAKHKRNVKHCLKGHATGLVRALMLSLGNAVNSLNLAARSSAGRSASCCKIDNP